MTTKTYEVKTSNGSYWQVHHVAASTEQEASELAVRDADKALIEERKMAAQAGLAAPGRYVAFSVVEKVVGDMPARGIRFVDSGAEG